jgi:hypothetical protein
VPKPLQAGQLLIAGLSATQILRREKSKQKKRETRGRVEGGEEAKKSYRSGGVKGRTYSAELSINYAVW